MIPEEAVEAAAEAIWHSAYPNTAWNNGRENIASIYRTRARAALEAAAPTIAAQALRDAADNAGPDDDDIYCDAIVSDPYYIGEAADWLRARADKLAPKES